MRERIIVYLFTYFSICLSFNLKENRLCGEQVVLVTALAATPVLARHRGFYVWGLNQSLARQLYNTIILYLSFLFKKIILFFILGPVQKTNQENLNLQWSSINNTCYMCCIHNKLS